MQSSSVCSTMPLKLPNPHIEQMEEDILYHLALGTKTHDLKAMFGDIKVTRIITNCTIY